MERFFTRVADGDLRASPANRSTFMLALAVILVWAVTGPIFQFSDTWQLIMNTGTTIITFLMVFLIQNAQNRDAAAMQAKLDELLRAVRKSARSVHRRRASHRAGDRDDPARSGTRDGRETRRTSQRNDVKGTVDRLLDRF